MTNSTNNTDLTEKLAIIATQGGATGLNEVKEELANMLFIAGKADGLNEARKLAVEYITNKAEQ